MGDDWIILKNAEKEQRAGSSIKTPNDVMSKIIVEIYAVYRRQCWIKSI